jgi:hypothetical protein
MVRRGVDLAQCGLHHHFNPARALEEVLGQMKDCKDLHRLNYFVLTFQFD